MEEAASASRLPYERRNDLYSLPGMDPPPERIDNISDTALRAFRVRYGDNAITKDAIFNYVYGVLHAPAYREKFANDLAKELPRIPFADDFHAFAEAGRRLRIHLGYETCPEHPLDLQFLSSGEPRPEHFHIGTKKMQFADDARTVLRQRPSALRVSRRRRTSTTSTGERPSNGSSTATESCGTVRAAS